MDDGQPWMVGFHLGAGATREKMEAFLEMTPKVR